MSVESQPIIISEIILQHTRMLQLAFAKGDRHQAESIVKRAFESLNVPELLTFSTASPVDLVCAIEVAEILADHRIYSVGNLIRRSETELLAMAISRQQIAKIRKALAENGMTLRAD
jgi:hypothetical protein